MSDRITSDEVLRVAHLARLSLDDDEAKAMTADLASILEYVEQLRAVETEDVPPTSHAIPMATPLREDRPEEPMDPDAALANAPAADGSAFRVPRVLPDEEEG